MEKLQKKMDKVAKKKKEMKNKMGHMNKEKEELLETIQNLEIQIQNFYSMRYEENSHHHNSCLVKIRALEEERNKLQMQISNTINKNNHIDKNSHHAYYNKDNQTVKINMLEGENSRLENQIISLKREIEVLKMNEKERGTDKIEIIKKKKKAIKKNFSNLQEKMTDLKKVKKKKRRKYIIYMQFLYLSFIYKRYI